MGRQTSFSSSSISSSSSSSDHFHEIHNEFQIGDRHLISLKDVVIKAKTTNETFTFDFCCHLFKAAAAAHPLWARCAETCCQWPDDSVQKGVCQKNNLICVVLYRVSANFFHRLRLIFERIFSHTVCTLTLFKSSKAKSDCLGYSLLGGGAVKRCSPVEHIYWVYLYKRLYISLLIPILSQPTRPEY